MEQKLHTEGIDTEISETVLLKNRAIEELFAKHGIKSVNETAKYQGKTSIVFMNSPRSASQDKAETALHYHNIRKGH